MSMAARISAAGKFEGVLVMNVTLMQREAICFAAGVVGALAVVLVS